MSDRATVIAHIWANLQRGRGTARDSHAGAAAAAADPEAASWPEDLLVERFSAELTAIAGRVHRAATARQAIDAILAVCREHEASRVLSWAPEWIGVPGLHDALTAGGIDIDGGSLPHGPERAERLAALDPIRVGLTGAIAGIAESGTIADEHAGRLRWQHRGAAGGSPVPVALGVPRRSWRRRRAGQ